MFISPVFEKHNFVLLDLHVLLRPIPKLFKTCLKLNYKYLKSIWTFLRHKGHCWLLWCKIHIFYCSIFMCYLPPFQNSIELVCSFSKWWIFFGRTDRHTYRHTSVILMTRLKSTWINITSCKTFHIHFMRLSRVR